LGSLESRGVIKKLPKGSEIVLNVLRRALVISQGIVHDPKSLVDVVDRATEGDVEAEGVIRGEGAIFPNKGKNGQEIHVKDSHRGTAESTFGLVEETTMEGIAHRDRLVIGVSEENLLVGWHLRRTRRRRGSRRGSLLPFLSTARERKWRSTGSIVEIVVEGFRVGFGIGKFERHLLTHLGSISKVSDAQSDSAKTRLRLGSQPRALLHQVADVVAMTELVADSALHLRAANVRMHERKFIPLAIIASVESAMLQMLHILLSEVGLVIATVRRHVEDHGAAITEVAATTLLLGDELTHQIVFDSRGAVERIPAERAVLGALGAALREERINQNGLR
jgi:hypothetical protein